MNEFIQGILVFAAFAVVCVLIVWRIRSRGKSIDGLEKAKKAGQDLANRLDDWS